MFELQCYISELKYEPALHFLLKKMAPHTDPLLRPFLENISQYTKEMTETILSTIPEKEIQLAIIYAVNQYQQKLCHSIEKFFFKKGFTVKVESLTVCLEENTSDFFVTVEFQLLSSSIKFITPLLSDKLFSRLLNSKHLTDALFPFIENALLSYFDFALFHDLSIIVK